MKHAYTKGPLSQYRNVNKAIRKKDSEAYARLNGLATDYDVNKGNKI